MLSGKKIVITRPKHQAAGFADKLRELDAEPLILPMIEIVPPEDTTELEAALQQSYDWTLFTSTNAVEMVMKYQPSDLGKVAAVGPKTAAVLEHVDLIAQRHVAEGLYNSLAQAEDLHGQRILLPQSDKARPVLLDLLRQAGADVTAVTAYRTIKAEADVDISSADVITFTSGSTVESFVDNYDDIGNAIIACIGPITAQTAEREGLPVHIVANPHTIDGLIDAIIKHYR
jgi:uroporphyrinogen-III synthase